MNTPLWSKTSLRRKCPYSKLFQSASFPHFSREIRSIQYLSVFSPNAVKMRTRITPNTDSFCVVLILMNIISLSLSQLQFTLGFSWQCGSNLRCSIANYYLQNLKALDLKTGRKFLLRNQICICSQVNQPLRFSSGGVQVLVKLIKS